MPGLFKVKQENLCTWYIIPSTYCSKVYEALYKLIWWTLSNITKFPAFLDWPNLFRVRPIIDPSEAGEIDPTGGGR